MKADLLKVYAYALDPLHIGAGGYRLGRVDNTIVREPATDIPKIPGTSIAGTVRAFYKAYLLAHDDECKKEKAEAGGDSKKAEEKLKPIFGDEEQKGILRFYDGRIIFFPVYSDRGTVWITTWDILEYWMPEYIKNGQNEPANLPDDRIYAVMGISCDKPLNLGWLLVKIEKADSEIELPDFLEKFIKRIVIVPENIFSHVVNDHLEVRTSVRINPETGAALEGGLFTYEAIPRGTLLGWEMGMEKGLRNTGDCSVSLEDVLANVKSYFKTLGIGGMGTRGFGRLELMVNNDCCKAGEGKNHEQSSETGGNQP